jgi:hypothetical protein
MANKELSAVWIPSEERAEKTREILNQEGAVSENLAFEPMTTIAIALGAATLATVLLRLYKEARYPGVLIDATRDPIEIREMTSWSRQQVLVITAESAQFHEFQGGSTDAAIKALVDQLRQYSS